MLFGRPIKICGPNKLEPDDFLRSFTLQMRKDRQITSLRYKTDK